MTKTEIFIQKAKKVHGNKYDYSKTHYVNSKTKVCIICPEHGEFWQTPNSHLSGSGCAECAQCKKWTTEKFITESNKVHNNFYNYDKTNYINCNTKVVITCPIHGDFEQTPLMHVRGQGCPHCRNKKIADKVKLTTEEFIEKAFRIHGDTYDYSKVEYTYTDKPVTIICRKHGEFQQIAHVHLKGAGCPICNMSHGEHLIRNYLYNNSINFTSQFLIQDSEFSQEHVYVDFKIEYNDQIIFIEYNGIQHYMPIEHFGGELRFKQQQSRDQQLKNYCDHNNIILLIFNYKQSKESILEQLDCVFQ